MIKWLISFTTTKNKQRSNMAQSIQSSEQVLISPMQNYLYQSLKMHGLDVRLNEKCGPYTADILLPRHKLMVQCIGADGLGTKELIEAKQRENYAKTLGWKPFIVRGSHLYQDMAKLVRLTRLSLSQQNVSKKTK